MNTHTKQIPELSLRVVIVEDDESIRKTIANFIDEAEGMSCVATYSSCEQALNNLDDSLPDVILMDIGLPGISGIEGVKKIKAQFPSVDIMMLSVYDDQERIFQSICAGASGYLVKNSVSDEIIKAIREIKHGAPMSASIARRVLSMVRANASPEKPSFDLTPREMDILQSLVEGLSYKMIADKHSISPFTVHTHIKRIYEKLHVHSKSEAVSKALKSKMF